MKMVHRIFDLLKTWDKLLHQRDEQIWSTKHRLFLMILGCLFSLALIGQFHGFSFPDWHRMIDGSQPTEVIFGQPRGIRSDDSFVILPLAISQAETDVRFACRNPLIGLGTEMHLVSRSLCLEGAGWVAAALRPITWGYLGGADLGMSWLWWSVFLGLLYVSFLLVYRLSERRFLFSLFVAIGFVFAPYQQFWSLNMGEIFLYGFASILFFDAYFNSFVALRRWVLAGLWAYSLGALILTLYPPTQVMVGYVMLPSHLAILIKAWNMRSKRSFTLLPLILSTCVLISCLGILFFASRESLFALMNSSYPGRRVSLGGGVPWQTLFQGLLLPSRSVGDWDVLGNVCEASTFLLFAPMFLALAMVRKDFRRTMTATPFLRAIIGLYVLLMAWTQWSFPESLARFSLLSFVPPQRAAAGLGILDLVIWVTLLISLVTGHTQRKLGWPDTIGSLLWLSCLLATAWHLNAIASIPWLRMAPYLILGFGAYGLAVRYPLGLGILFAIWSLSLTMHFNPLVRGGHRFIATHPLSQLIQEVARTESSSHWVIDNQDLVLGNLPRMLGVASLGGTHVYPQLALWREFDPQGRSEIVYNRYAHIVFDFKKGAQPNFQLRAQDSFVLTVDPEHPAFKRLGVNIFMVRESAGALEQGPFKLIDSFRDWRIYKRL
jgi:hypothetical protein